MCVVEMHNAGAYSQVTVDVATAGNTTLAITYATGLDGVTKSLYINDVDVMTLNFSNVGWTTFVDMDVTVNLTAGINTIKIQNDADDVEGVNLDKYTVGGGSAASSSPSSTPDGTYQAEDGTWGNGADVREEGGVMCVVEMHNAGAYSQVTVDVATAGNTTLAITYATGLDGVTKSLYINDVDVMTLNFSNVGWTTFVDMDVTVNLTAGINTIKIQNDADDNEGVNLDKYSL